MKENKLTIVAIAALFLMTFLFIPQVGCSGEISVTTASLSEATMCKSVDSKTQKPVEKADVFAPATPMIYCSVKLTRAKPLGASPRR